MSFMKTYHLPRRARSRALLSALLAVPLLTLAPLADRASAAACGDTYTVQPGDSLWSISQSCGVATSTLQSLNRLGAVLQPGQVLQLTDPYALRDYVVQPGDTLLGIALQLGIAPGTLAATNALSNLDILQVGQVLHWRRVDVAQAASVSPAGAATAASGTGASAAPSGATYTVRPGDTLWSIAQAQHISVAALASANGMTTSQVLQVGRVLRLPVATATSAASATASTTSAAGTTVIARSGVYQVKPGDTLWGIAQALGLSPDALAQANGIAATAVIHPGQILHYSVVVYSGPSREEIGTVLDQQAAQVGVEGALLKAIAWRESSWLMVDAPDGGMGVMQLMPDTVRWLQSTYVPGAWDPHDLTANIHAGAEMLLLYSRLYGGDVAKIAAAYHGGMGAVSDAAMRKPEMSRYIQSVIAYRNAFLHGTWPQ
jgi:LysM repeat protein